MGLEEGDMISTVGRLGTRHFGIFSGYTVDGTGWVVHASKDRMRVVEEPLPVFCEQYAVRIEKRADPGWGSYVVGRARSHLGRTYDLIHFNCEHLATIAQDQEARSPQLQQAATTLSVALGLALLSLAMAPGVGTAGVYALTGYDGNVGRWRDRSGRFV